MTVVSDAQGKPIWLMWNWDKSARMRDVKQRHKQAHKKQKVQNRGPLVMQISARWNKFSWQLSALRQSTDTALSKSWSKHLATEAPIISLGIWLTLLSYTRRQANKPTHTIWQSADVADNRAREKQGETGETHWRDMEADTERGLKREDNVIAEEKTIVEKEPPGTMLGYSRVRVCRGDRDNTDKHKVYDSCCNTCNTNAEEWLVMNEDTLGQGNSQVWSVLTVCMIRLSAALMLPVLCLFGKPLSGSGVWQRQQQTWATQTYTQNLKLSKRALWCGHNKTERCESVFYFFNFSNATYSQVHIVETVSGPLLWRMPCFTNES